MVAKDMSGMVREILTWLGTGTVLFLGRPYSGKSYQAKNVGGQLGLPILDSGEVLRAMRAKLPPNEVAIQDAGGLISTDAFSKALLPQIKSMPTGQGAIFCSVGKKNGEQYIVMAACEQAEKPIKAVVYINVPRDGAIGWWRSEQQASSTSREIRSDDATEAHQEDRHNVFAGETRPVINFYRDKGLLVEVDGYQPKEVVTEGIIHALYKMAREAQSPASDKSKV